VVLDTHTLDLSGFDLPENLQKLRYQRHEKLELVPSSHQNDHGYLKVRNILLIVQPLVGGDEHLELAGSDCKKGPILEGRPTHFRNGTNLMTVNL
jgi:hypothetical protein